MSIYETTYTFEGHYSGTPTEILERSFETLAYLQGKKVDIEYLGGTVILGADGPVSEGTARYAAPTEGHVGWLAVHASLPISGIRRIEPRNRRQTGRGRYPDLGRAHVDMIPSHVREGIPR